MTRKGVSRNEGGGKMKGRKTTEGMRVEGWMELGRRREEGVLCPMGRLRRGPPPTSCSIIVEYEYDEFDDDNARQQKMQSRAHPA